MRSPANIRYMRYDEMTIDLKDGRWEELVPNDKFVTKLKEFYGYCDAFDMTYPDVFKTKGDDYTSATEVGITGDSDIPHAFGHFLCDYHVVDPDVVADIIKKLVLNHKDVLEKTKLQFEEEINYNMGLYR